MEEPADTVAKCTEAEGAAGRPVITATSPPGRRQRATLLNFGANCELDKMAFPQHLDPLQLSAFFLPYSTMKEASFAKNNKKHLMLIAPIVCIQHPIKVWPHWFTL